MTRAGFLNHVFGPTINDEPMLRRVVAEWCNHPGWFAVLWAETGARGCRWRKSVGVEGESFSGEIDGR